MMLGLVLAACSPSAAPPGDASGGRLPVDDRVQLAAAAQWPHRQAVEADVDGDGTAEGVVLVSDVTLDREGRPLWEDGHRWAVFVDDEGQRTLLYGDFVPNGHVEAGVVSGAEGRARHVLVRERTPQRARTFVIAYDGPGAARGVSAAAYQVEQWVPSLAP